MEQQKKTKLRSYRIHVMQELCPTDFIAQMRYWEWFLNIIHDNNTVLDKVFCWDETWFHVNSYVNSQNGRVWNAAPPPPPNTGRVSWVQYHFRRIWGSYIGGYEEFCLLGCNAV
jgi:hypothetical protein